MTEETTPGPDRAALDEELQQLAAVLAGIEKKTLSGAMSFAVGNIRWLRQRAETVLHEVAPDTGQAADEADPAPESGRTTPAADRVLRVRQALNDELEAMGINTQLGVDGHAVKRMASAVLRALDGDPS